MTHDIILTDPYGETGRLVASSLSEYGLHPYLLEDVSARRDVPGFLRRVRQALDETGAQMLMPVFYPQVLAAHRAEFQDVIIPLDDADKIQMLDNKIAACRIAAGASVPQPHIFSNFSEVESYPVVFKRAFGQGGDSVYFPGSREALEKLAATAAEYLVTEYIEGVNICADCLRWDGFFYAAAYRVLEPAGKGVSNWRESIEDKRIADYCRAILDAVDYKGPCSVDFRKDASGKLYFLECNPRFSGGLESAIASGFNLPVLYYRLARGERIDISDIVFKRNIRTGAPKTAPISF